MPKLKLNVKGEFPNKEELMQYLKEKMPDHEIKTHFLAKGKSKDLLLLVKSPDNAGAMLGLNYSKKRIDIIGFPDSFLSAINPFKMVFRLATSYREDKLLSDIHRALYPKYVINEPT